MGCFIRRSDVLIDSDGVVRSSIIAGCGYYATSHFLWLCNEMNFENDWSVDGVQGERQS